MKFLWMWVTVAVFGLCAAQEDRGETQPLPEQTRTRLEKVIEQMASDDAKVRAKARADMRKILVAADGKDLQHVMVAWLKKERTKQKNKTVKRELDIVLRPWRYYDRLYSLKAYKVEVGALAFSPDGRLLASGGTDSTGSGRSNPVNTVKIWDLKTGKCLKTLVGHSNTIGHLAFSDDSKILVSSACDSTIYVWDVKTGEALKKIEQGPDGHVVTPGPFVLSRDGKRLAVCGHDDCIWIWDIEKKKVRDKSGGELIRKIEMKNVRKVPGNRIFRGLSRGDGDEIVVSLLVAGRLRPITGELRVFDMNTGRHIRTIQLEGKILYMTESKVLLGFDHSARIKFELRDIKSGKVLHKVDWWVKDKVVASRGMRAFCWGEAVASCCFIWKEVRINDVQTGKRLRTLKMREGKSKVMLISKDSSVLVVGTGRGTIEIWAAP